MLRLRPGADLVKLGLLLSVPFFQTDVVQAAHPVVLSSQQLPFPPHVVSGLSVYHSGILTY